MQSVSTLIGMSGSFRISEPAPSVVKKANEIVSQAGARTPQEKALALFLFVRDSIKFGFTRNFDEASPEATLRSGVGHCNPQGTLFASLLQSQDIEAQQRFVNLSPSVLRGVLSPCPPRLLHSYVELRLPPSENSASVESDHNEWIRIDGYIADKPLFNAAKTRLLREKTKEGFGIHVDGSVEWDGKSECFCQMADERTQVSEDLGTFDRPADLYSSPRNFQRLPWLVRLTFGLFIAMPNSAIQAVRDDIVPTTAVKSASTAA